MRSEEPRSRRNPCSETYNVFHSWSLKFTTSSRFVHNHNEMYQLWNVMDGRGRRGRLRTMSSGICHRVVCWMRIYVRQHTASQLRIKYISWSAVCKSQISKNGCSWPSCYDELVWSHRIKHINKISAKIQHNGQYCLGIELRARWIIILWIIHLSRSQRIRNVIPFRIGYLFGY
jgi:hypothetical protein